MQKIIRRIDGIVKWHEKDLLIRALGRNIDLSHDNGLTFQRIGKVSLDTIRNIASTTRLGRRLVRSNVKHVAKLGSDSFLAFAGKSIFSVDTKSKSIHRLSTINGSRPLRVCVHENSVFYGEYRSNPERSPINLWRSKDDGASWSVLRTFDGIRHIHGVYWDPYESCFWLTTGDLNEEAAIWNCGSSWSQCEKILSGSQQSRVIDLLFTEDSIFYGTDAPDEENWLVQLDRSSGEVTNLTTTAGPLFHAKAHEDGLFFSTAREPSELNCSNEIQVWRVKKCQPELIMSFEKDRWSMKYFQYGQVFFADGPGEAGVLWVSPFATRRNDQTSYLLDVSQ